ncbi:glycosyltransferase [uncultured Sphingomonas sp.]|uniref:glycosyltransferase n=1 Tax=uncultured Sphingomonas sp. TaxID=158754 RepID=UPI0025F4E5C5|nr:glycosyltransferase [uncultured Sphingomonas sp.]
MKVAVVHFWWLSNRGGEAVVAAILEMFPDADLFVQVCDEELVRRTLGPGFRGRIIPSFVSRLPGARRHYKKYMPLMPLALEQWDFSEYDLVISSESGPAKGVVTRPDALHICYCHSPMRYIWDLYQPYLRESGWLIRKLFPLIAHWLRVWDRSSADRVDHFIANSRFIAARIAKFYRRTADVIWPPVNVTAFDPTRERGDFYLCLGQLVRYKRADLAVEAFNTLGLPLVVIGEGDLMEDLRKRAKPNICLLGRQPFDVVKDHLERCRGLIFPGIEDFGIVPVEAMAAGAPVIAYGRGGILDTVIDGKTGILFHEDSAEALVEAVQMVERGDIRFDAAALHRHAERFDKERFTASLTTAIAQHRAAQLQATGLPSGHIR